LAPYAAQSSKLGCSSSYTRGARIEQPPIGTKSGLLRLRLSLEGSVIIALAAYLVIGGTLGFFWNRSELNRSPVRRLAPSFCAFLLAWPALVAGALVVAAVWTRVWRRAHNGDRPAQPRTRFDAVFAKSPAPHPL
jgi:hypothetical protein